MSLSKREQVLQAVEALLKRALPHADVARNATKSTSIKITTVRMRDGEPGEPDVSFSPRMYWYEHQIPVSVAVAGELGADTSLDDDLRPIGLAIAADRTLGGLCEDLDVTAAETDPIAVEGARGGRWADFFIVPIYGTPNPLL